MMSAKAGKRPLRSLTAHEKLDAIKRVHDGESKASVARDIGVPESTLRGWCKNEDKISYLSRQSSPEHDDSNDVHKEKKIKLDENAQPFNLSLKNPPSTASYSPNSDKYAVDYSTANNAKADVTPKIDATPKMSEREKNRAELARLSVELGLNRPEMFLSNLSKSGASNIADITANINLLAQWNSLLLQQTQLVQQQGNKKVTAPADTTNNSLLTTVKPNSGKQSPLKLPKDKPLSVEDSVWYWLKSQQNMQFANLKAQAPTTSVATPVTSVASTTSPLTGVTPDQSSWFWKWYKQFAYPGQIQYGATSNDKPILYQQLTKETSGVKEVENEKSKSDDTTTATTPTNRARAVLDNLLFCNNNNVPVSQKSGKEDEQMLSHDEALDHGEKFLKWLEGCGEPSVTAMQIMQFKSLLGNVRASADRKNNVELNNKMKVKRK